MKYLKSLALVSVLCMTFCRNVCAAGLEMTEINLTEELEDAGAEETGMAENDEGVQENAMPGNDTSVVIPQENRYATQLGVSDLYMANPYNDIKNLKVPAQLTRQGDYYFIVDTYNDQVLYADDLWKPVDKWRVMDRKLNKPHAIASDGSIYLVADTDNNRVLCYEYIKGRFQNTQRFDDVGTRPHYIQYDAVSESFFVWSSLTGDMYIMKKQAGSSKMYIEEIRHIYELDGFYVRSFCIEGDEMLFPSGNNEYMVVADKETLHVKCRYPVPGELSGMAFVKKIGSYYYMTVSTDDRLSHKNARIIRTQDLQSLSQGEYEDVTRYFDGMRVPYYIDKIGGSYYMTSHEGKKSVYKFDVVEDRIKNVVAVH